MKGSGVEGVAYGFLIILMIANISAFEILSVKPVIELDIGKSNNFIV